MNKNNSVVSVDLPEDQAKVWDLAYATALEKFTAEGHSTPRVMAVRSAWDALGQDEGESLVEEKSTTQDVVQADSTKTDKTVAWEQYLENAYSYAERGHSALTQHNINQAALYQLIPADILRSLQETLDEARSPVVDTTPAKVYRREFSADRREELAKQGKALPDGSFPIENRGDLENAIKLAGMGKNPSAAKGHIQERAAALGLESMIPDTWKSETAVERAEGEKEMPEWYMERFWNRYNEATRDRDLVERYGANAQVERLEGFSSGEWLALTPEEKTLGGQVTRRQIRRNYFQTADEMILAGWDAVPVKGKETGELEFRTFVRKNDVPVLERAILVRKADTTEFFPYVQSEFISGAMSIKLPHGLVRL